MFGELCFQYTPQNIMTIGMHNTHIIAYHFMHDVDKIIKIRYLSNLPDVASRFGSPGLKRTDTTVSTPHSKLFTGCDLM